MQKIVGIGEIKAFIGAIVMELGTGLCEMSDKTAWMILWLLLAVTIATMPEKTRKLSMRPNQTSRRLGR